MKKIEKPSVARRRKGLHLTEREMDEVFSGGTFELEVGRDFDGAASTAAQHLRDEWRRRYGQIEITPDGKSGVVMVTVTPPGRRA